MSLPYLAHLGTLFCIFVTVLVSLNLTAGYCGMLSIAHAMFFGLGAYAAAHVATATSSEFVVPMLAGALTAGAAAAALSALLVRLHDDYFVLATFASQVVAYELFVNLDAVTGGVNGFGGIPAPTLFGWTMNVPERIVGVAAVMAMLAVLIGARIHRSHIRRILIGLKEDEIYLATLGINVVFAKSLVFTCSAAIAGAAGAFYAQYMSFIAPIDFTVFIGIMWLVVLVLGGQGATYGPVIGAALLVLLPEILRFLGIPGQSLGNVRQIILGAIFVAILLWRPGGISGSAEAKERTYD